MRNQIKENTEHTIHTLLWGKDFVDVVDQNNNDHTFIMRSLTIKEQNLVNYIYKKEYDKAVSLGVLRYRDLVELFSAQGIWTEEDDLQILNLENKLKSLSSRLEDVQFLRAKKKKIESEIKKSKKELKHLKELKLSLFAFTAEQRAEEVSRRYVVFLSAQDTEENQFWQDERTFLHETDSVILFNLARAYYDSLLNEEEIRFIARSNEWRYRWNASKNGESLFGCPISDWSDMQNTLVFWSQYYDNVFSSVDAPPPHIVENDDALDQWVKDQNKKHSKTKSKINPNHNEVFMMVDPNDKESIEKIQKMNPTAIRRKLQAEYKQIKNSKGRIKEWDLGTRNKDTKINT